VGTGVGEGLGEAVGTGSGVGVGGSVAKAVGLALGEAVMLKEGLAPELPQAASSDSSSKQPANAVKRPR